MFLFISTSSPVASIVSLVVFFLTLVFSTPGVLGEQFLREYLLAPGTHHLALLLVFLSTAGIIWLYVQQGVEPIHDGAQQQQQHRTPALDADALRALIHQLPLEPWLCRESRAKLGVRELQTRLRQRRVPLKGLVERGDLVDALEASPHETLCAICYDEFTDGEELRMLPCSHAFHVECVDRWLLDCGANRRVVACPLCNTALDTHACARGQHDAAREARPGRPGPRRWWHVAWI